MQNFRDATEQSLTERDAAFIVSKMGVSSVKAAGSQPSKKFCEKLKDI
jgi:hypothetical protein